MAGLLPDFSNGPPGLLGFLSNLFSSSPANAQPVQQPSTGLMPPPITAPLPLAQRPMEALGGFLNAPGGALGGIIGAGKTLFGGELSDPQSITQNNLRLQYQLLKQAGFNDTQAMLAIMNPKVGEQAGGAVVNPTTSNIGNTVLQNVAGGGVRPVFREPLKPEMTEVIDNRPGSPTFGQKIRTFAQPPEPFGGYGVVGPNMVVPGKTPGAPAPLTGMPSGLSPQQEKEQSATGEILADTYKGYVNAGVQATKRLNTLQRMSQLSPDAYEGQAAPALQMFRSALTTFGLNPGQVPKGEEFNALSNKLVLDSMPNGSLGTGISNADRDYIGSTVPTLSNTKEGRKQLIETATMLAKREQQISSLATQYRKQNGTIEGFDNFLADWSEKNPLFAGRQPPSTTFDNRFGAASQPALPGGTGYKIIGVR